MPDTALETDLRAQLHALGVAPDDALADEMSVRAATRRRRSMLPLQAAAAVVALTVVTAAVTASIHRDGSAGPSPSPTSVGDGTGVAPSQPDQQTVRLRCVTSDGRVSEPTVTLSPDDASRDGGNWARVYLPKADGSICTQIDG